MAATFTQEQEALQTALTGCPDPTQGSAIVVPGVAGGKICKDLTDSEGNSINLCDWAYESYEHYVLIANAVCASSGPHKLPLEITDIENGRVCFELTAALASYPGIYDAEWHIVDADGVTQVYDKGLISVEPTLAMRVPGRIPPGPITIAELRRRLRDFPALNEYWGQSEFSNEELVAAILEPIYYFNETLPHSVAYSPTNFPFRFNWIEAIVARLLTMAGTWYMREERSISYADGKVDSSKGKAREYLEVGEVLWRKYQMFVEQQKMRAHWSGGGHSFSGNML